MNKLNPLKFGIIGCSRIAKKSVIPAILKSEFAELEMIGSRTNDKAKEFSNEFNCKKNGTYDDVISDDSINVIYISTPIGTHEELAIKAGISGEIIEVIPNRGVVIQEVGALVQGIWGNGRVNSGTLHILADKPDHVIEASQMDISIRSFVILGGSCQDAESLKAAADITVRGLILSSLHPSLLGLARKMPYPIIITDAIGKKPMNASAHKIISTNQQRENVTVNAEAYHHYTGTRPEVIIPLPHSNLPPPPRKVESFAPDQKVRLRRRPHAGATGILVELPSALQTLPNGLRVVAGKVKLTSGEEITVPLVNLEVLG